MSDNELKKENVSAFYAFVSSIQTIVFLMEITGDFSIFRWIGVSWERERELYTGELTMCELCTGELSTCEQTFHNSPPVNWWQVASFSVSQTRRFASLKDDWSNWRHFKISKDFLQLRGFLLKDQTVSGKVLQKENVSAIYAFVSSIQTIVFLMEITGDFSILSI